MSSRAKKLAALVEPPWTPFERCDTRPEGVSPERRDQIAKLFTEGTEFWTNSRYTVIKRNCGSGPMGPLFHLSIRRNDRAPCHDWRDFQRIKNELVGPETEGIELYPSESRLVDTSNQYHLWVLTECRLPFGFDEGRLVSGADTVVANAVQRPFDEPPPDMKTSEQMREAIRKIVK